MPVDGRETAGWLFSRGHDHGLGPAGDHLGIGGTSGNTGKLIFLNGGDMADAAAGRTEIARWTWHHLVLVRDDGRVRVYLDGQPMPEIDIASAGGAAARINRLFFGGRCDNESNWEGRLDEIAVFTRALTPAEIASLSAE